MDPPEEARFAGGWQRGVSYLCRVPQDGAVRHTVAGVPQQLAVPDARPPRPGPLRACVTAVGSAQPRRLPASPPSIAKGLSRDRSRRARVTKALAARKPWKIEE